jgi:hypothetical protein
MEKPKFVNFWENPSMYKNVKNTDPMDVKAKLFAPAFNSYQENYFEQDGFITEEEILKDPLVGLEYSVIEDSKDIEREVQVWYDLERNALRIDVDDYPPVYQDFEFKDILELLSGYTSYADTGFLWDALDEWEKVYYSKEKQEIQESMDSMEITAELDHEEMEL